MTDQKYIGDYAELRGESGARMIWHDFQFLDNTVKFDVDVSVHWAEATNIRVYASYDEINKFCVNLKSLGDFEKRNVKFDDYERVSLSLEFSLTRTGLIGAFGELRPDPSQKSRLIFQLGTYSSDVVRFQAKLATIVKRKNDAENDI